jgi:hypothetical protein
VSLPRTTLAYLPEGWQQMARDAAQEGAGTLKISALLGITRDRWQTLHKDYEEFRQVMDECKMLSQIWWEEHGQRMATGECDKGSAAVWIFNMKNRYGWRDKQEITGADGGPLNHTARVEFVE